MKKTVLDDIDDVLEYCKNRPKQSKNGIDMERLRKCAAIDSRLMEARESFIVTSPIYIELFEPFLKAKTDEELDCFYRDKIDYGIAERAKKLELLFIKSRPSAQVEKYLSEVSRCYIYGFFLGCIVLCRAVVEESIKGALRERSIRFKNQDSLATLIATARDNDVLNQELAKEADNIRHLGNDYLHKKPSLSSCEDSAFNSLTKTKGILACLYKKVEPIK